MGSKSRAIRLFGIIAALSALPLLAGCGPSTGDVTGKVLLNGKPLSFGTVTMIGADGITKSAQIMDDGSYTIFGIASGTAKILVESPKPNIVAGSPAAVAGAPGGAAAADQRAARGRAGADLPPDAPKVERPKDDVPTVSAEAAKKWVAISPDYADNRKSTLTLVVRVGKNEHNVELR